MVPTRLIQTIRRRKARQCTISGLELPSFNRLLESLSFSRFDRRLARVNLSRLDRCYGDVFMWTRSNQLGIMPGFSFFDHSPLKLNFFLSSVRRTHRFRIPNYVFFREDCKYSVQSIWSRRLYDKDVVLTNVVHVLTEIQEVFQHKAKALYLEYDSKIGRYKRALTTLQHL